MHQKPISTVFQTAFPGRGLGAKALVFAACSLASISGHTAGSPGFLERLDSHLAALAERGLITRPTADGIRKEFRHFEERNPEIFRQPGFEYAIPEILKSAQASVASANEPESPGKEEIGAILGTASVTEENVGEVFRRVLTPKAGAGTRNPQGTIDAWTAKLDAMGKDGRRKTLVNAINGMATYAGRKGLRFDADQVRRGLVHTASCIAALPDTNPRLYVESCGYVMSWIGERPASGTARIQFINTETGAAGVRRTLAAWDTTYAQEVYGPAFTEVQAKANDAFWKDYFKLYVGTAEAKDATLRARDSGELLKLEISVGRVMKLLLSYVQGGAFEGQTVRVSDIRQELEIAKALKAKVEATASPTIKARDGYRDTMQHYEQTVARARTAGIY